MVGDAGIASRQNFIMYILVFVGFLTSFKGMNFRFLADADDMTAEISTEP